MQYQIKDIKKKAQRERSRRLHRIWESDNALRNVHNMKKKQQANSLHFIIGQNWNYVANFSYVDSITWLLWLSLAASLTHDTAADCKNPFIGHKTWLCFWSFNEGMWVVKVKRSELCERHFKKGAQKRKKQNENLKSCETCADKRPQNPQLPHEPNDDSTLVGLREWMHTRILNIKLKHKFREVRGDSPKRYETQTHCI